MHDLWKTAKENMDDDTSRNYINFYTESDLFKILLKCIYKVPQQVLDEKF